MNKFVYTGFIILAIFCLAAIFYLLPQFSGKDNQVINIALADPDVKIAIDNNHGKYKIEGVIPQNLYNESGFFNISENLTIVKISLLGQEYGFESYIVFIDINHSKIIGKEWYSNRGIPAELFITLSPGAYYYHALYGPVSYNPGDDFGVGTFFYRITKIFPDNATIYPILVDKENLMLIKNGSSYTSATYIDTYTHMPAILNGSLQVNKGWSVNASINISQDSDKNTYPELFLILVNKGTDNACLDVTI